MLIMHDKLKATLVADKVVNDVGAYSPDDCPFCYNRLGSEIPARGLALLEHPQVAPAQIEIKSENGSVKESGTVSSCVSGNARERESVPVNGSAVVRGSEVRFGLYLPCLQTLGPLNICTPPLSMLPMFLLPASCRPPSPPLCTGQRGPTWGFARGGGGTSGDAGA
jgi:hypothetical protein